MFSYKTEQNRKHNWQLYTGNHIAEDHILTDIATCNIEEPQQKYRLGTVSNKLLGGGLNMFYWMQILALTETTYCDTWGSLGCQITALKYRLKTQVNYYWPSI